MRISYIIALIFALSSCQNHNPKIQFVKMADFILVDTSFLGDKSLNINERYSDYPIYYIGSIADTINTGSKYKIGQTKWKEESIIFCSRKYTDSTLKIVVDTASKTTSTVEYFSENYKTFDSTGYFKSFFFTIQNISDSSLYLVRTFDIYYITRQVKNKYGHWTDLDKRLSEIEICLTGQPLIVLKPKEIVISKLKRYSGKFFTEFRLAFGTRKNVVYSAKLNI